MQGKISMDLSFCQSEQGFSWDELVLKLADVYERKAFAELLKLILQDAQRDSVEKNTSVSLFRQVLDLILKVGIWKSLDEIYDDKRKQFFECWTHFIWMIFCKLIQVNNLCKIHSGLRPAVGTEPSWSRKPRVSFRIPINIGNRKFSGTLFILLKHCKAIPPKYLIFDLNRKQRQLQRGTSNC